MSIRHVLRRIHRIAIPLLATLALAACNPVDVFDASSPGKNNSPGQPKPTPTPTPTTNKPPTISGQPGAAANVGQLYEFAPQANDPDGDTLRFEIKGRPAWATFDPNTGRLYGTPLPGADGTVSGIEIAVTDGLAKAALPSFSITVTDAPANGVAELAWTAPTQNTDGSALDDLAGFRIYYGRLPDALSQKLEIANPAARSAAIQQLGSGTWYFAISAYSVSGVESARTRPVWKSI